jgi:hypothetical protein
MSVISAFWRSAPQPVKRSAAMALATSLATATMGCMLEKLKRDNNRVLLGLIMLGVLVLSTALAWFVGYVHASPARRGENLMAELYSQGVDPADLREESYYEVTPTSNGRAIGWFARLTEGDETIRGVTLHASAGRRPTVELWTLGNDLREGLYQARELVGRQATLTTRIALSGDQMSVEMFDGPGRAAATAQRPDNYIPEGLMTLVAARVAQSGEPAAFKIILNEAAIDAGRLYFADVQMTPRGQRRVEVQIMAVGQRISSLYQFDEQWRMEWRQIGPLKYRRVDLEQLVQIDPQAADLLAWSRAMLKAATPDEPEIEMTPEPAEDAGGEEEPDGEAQLMPAERT